jgi:putative endonuclease
MGMTAWVYILRCKDGSLYTGWTTDVDRRLEEHQQGKAAKYTRGLRPVGLAYRKKLASRSAAMRAEERIKRKTRDWKLALIAGRMPSPFDMWEMDAVRHTYGGSSGPHVDPCRCAKRDWIDTCSCGGLRHSQGCYGGVLRFCEDCGKDD